MISSNDLYNASNILVQAGYLIKEAPIPTVYATAGQSVVNLCLALLAVIGAAGSAYHSWQTRKIVNKSLAPPPTPKP